MTMSFSIEQSRVKLIRVRKLQEFGFESCFGLLLETRGSLERSWRFEIIKQD